MRRSCSDPGGTGKGQGGALCLGEDDLSGVVKFAGGQKRGLAAGVRHWEIWVFICSESSWDMWRAPPKRQTDFTGEMWGET